MENCVPLWLWSRATITHYHSTSPPGVKHLHTLNVTPRRMRALPRGCDVRKIIFSTPFPSSGKLLTDLCSFWKMQPHCEQSDRRWARERRIKAMLAPRRFVNGCGFGCVSSGPCTGAVFRYALPTYPVQCGWLCDGKIRPKDTLGHIVQRSRSVVASRKKINAYKCLQKNATDSYEWGCFVLASRGNENKTSWQDEYRTQQQIVRVRTLRPSRISSLCD